MRFPGFTGCTPCHAALIVRDRNQVDACEVTPDGKCPHCVIPVAGVFEAFHGQFGGPRIPVAINRR